MDMLISILGSIFIGCIISIAIFVTMKCLNMDIESKYSVLLSGLIIGIALFLFALRSDIRDKKLYDIISNSNSVEEIQEQTYEYFEYLEY